MKPIRPRRIAVAIEYELPDGGTFILAAASHAALRRAAKAAKFPEPEDDCICKVSIAPRISKLTEPQN
jgi:hypothetical protein